MMPHKSAQLVDNKLFIGLAATQLAADRGYATSEASFIMHIYITLASLIIAMLLESRNPCGRPVHDYSMRNYINCWYLASLAMIRSCKAIRS